MSNSLLVPTRAADILRQSPHPLLRDLEVKETSDGIVISGTLPSYYLKQMAQETLRPILDGRKLENRIYVPDMTAAEQSPG